MKKISKKELLEMSFSERLEKLEEIYHHIQQSEDKDIENIIKLYESGSFLAKSLENNIKSYELKIQEVQDTDYDVQEIATETTEEPLKKKASPKSNKKTKKDSLLFDDENK